MKFKKDYINFLLHKLIYVSNNDFKNDLLLRSLADKIIAVEDVGKITYLVGKTAGLEPLFKYLLYISDKIDKSQISVFNLKDNIDYDLGNLIKICNAIKNYNQEKSADLSEIEIEEKNKKQPIIIDLSKEDNLAAKVSPENETSEIDETEQDETDSGMTLIENIDSKTEEGEVFELENISETVENTGLINETEVTEEQTKAELEDYKSEDVQADGAEFEDKSDFKIEEQDKQIPSEQVEAETDNLVLENEQEKITAEDIKIEDIEDIINKESPEKEFDEETGEEPQEEIEEIPVLEIERNKELEPEIEIEVNKPMLSETYDGTEEPLKEESVPNEAYYKFETKFFEEVKILEKLLSTVDKEFKNNIGKKPGEKSIQSLTEIIEITSELSNLSRQLMFDLIADVFLTMNLYFTKVISSPEIFDSEKNMLFDSSMALVNSLIKGEDYLNYDIIIDKIEKLKNQLTRTEEEQFKDEEPVKKISEKETIPEKAGDEEHVVTETSITEEDVPKPVSQADDSALFKLKYLVKEFEKSFAGISSIKGEYGRFEALEKINELNNALRLIARIASSVKQNDVLKLAEVTYVFLKYLKDYRIDLLDAEIQQIIKYIIFTFKMLLTSRKPDDFNILVQHLNNPVKIFTDS